MNHMRPDEPEPAALETIAARELRDRLIEQFGLPTSLAPVHANELGKQISSLIPQGSGWPQSPRACMVQLIETLGFDSWNKVTGGPKQIKVTEGSTDWFANQVAEFSPDPQASLIRVRYQQKSLGLPTNVLFDSSLLAETVGQIFDLPELTIQFTRNRPSGMTFHGMPAEFQSVTLETLFQTKNDALRVAQAAKLMPYLVKALDVTIRDRINTLTAYDARAGRGTYLLDPENEITLGEVIEKLVFEEVIKYINKHPEIGFWHLTNYDARLSATDIQVLVEQEEWQSVFGRSERMRVTKQLGTQPVPKIMPELSVAELTLKSASTSLRLPLRSPLSLTIDQFYGDNLQRNSLKADLRRRFLNWYENQTTQPKSTDNRFALPEINIKTLDDALKLYNITREQFATMTSDDLSAHKKPMFKYFHPDRHRDELDRIIAEHIMKEINLANEILTRNLTPLPRRD